LKKYSLVTDFEQKKPTASEEKKSNIGKCVGIGIVAFLGSVAISKYFLKFPITKSVSYSLLIGVLSGTITSYL